MRFAISVTNIIIMANFNVVYKRVTSTTVKATLTLNSNESKAPTSIPIIVLDRSGSMAGSRIRDCVGAVRHILSKIGRARLITYESNAQDHGFISDITQVSTGGLTSFRAAYDKIIEVMNKSNGPFQVIFLTDGEDTVSGRIHGQVDKDRAQLKKQLMGKTCVIHTIGIEADSDTQHMLDLSRCGSSEGTYGYFSKNINSYIDEAERLVKILGCMVEIKFRGTKYFLGSDPVVSFITDTETECGVPDTIDEIEYLAFNANDLIRQGTNAQLKDVQALRDHAQQIFEAAGRQPRVARKMLRERLTPIHELINEFYQMANTRNVTHEKLALLNVAARNARSNRFTKKVVDRTEQNLAIIQREDSDLLALTSDIAKLNLDDQPEALSCTLSCMSIPDLLRDGDCIGIGVRATVREACIVDPTLLQVDGISTSQFGCAAFLEAAEYASRNTNVQYGASTNVVMDSSRTAVSGVLPLYLNPTHWRVAKLYLRRMAGHLCCKDPILGTNRVTFYTYLHVYRYCRLQKGEFYTRMTGLVRETLEKVYEMMPSMIPAPNTFCGVIAQRMPDVVPSITLLEEAYLALSLPCDRPFLREYMVEEKLRRKKNKIEIGDIFSINEDHWIRPFVQANTPNESSGVYTKLISYVSTHSNAIDALNRTIGSIEQDAESSTENSVQVPDVDTYEPIILIPKWMEGLFGDLSEKRRAVIALQVSDLVNMTDCVNRYKDMFHMSDEAIHKIIKDKAVDHIKTRRSSELTSIIDAMRRDSTSAHTARLRRGVSLLERVAILHGNCYIGRNISEFALTATNLDELKMLVTGKHDIGPLIGHNEPVLIDTVMDIDSYHGCRFPLFDDGKHQIEYQHLWLPNRRTLKQWCRVYPYDKLVAIIPPAEDFLKKYCV